MVPPTSHKVSRVSWYFGYCLSLFVFPYGAFTLSGRLSQYRSGNSEYNLLQSLTLQCTHHSLGSFPFARRYSGNRCFFLFLRVLRCFSSPGSLHTLWIGVWILEVYSSGFPHSEISGSKDICSSPKLIAAYHVFHRLLVPRHPPCALYSLTIIEMKAVSGFLRRPLKARFHKDSLKNYWTFAKQMAWVKQGFTNDRCLLVRVLPISAIHSVVSMVLGLFVACFGYTFV